MPDLFAHYATADMLTFADERLGGHARPTQRKKAFWALFIFGATLPDVVTRAPMILFDILLGLDLDSYFTALHTPVGFTLLCYLLALLFEEHLRSLAFTALLGGALFHQAADLLQTTYNEGSYMLLYPFSTAFHHLDLIHYNGTIYLFPLLLPLVLWLHWRGWKKRRSGAQNASNNG